MNKWKLSANNKPLASLHKNIIDILFEHKKEISRKLSDIRGVYGIDHVAINVINPANEVVIFSTTPSVEYNLIVQELWRYDKSFLPFSFPDGSLLWWEEAYFPSYFNELKSLKETKHQFTLGFSLVKKINQFHLVYSFATRNQSEDLQNYYKNLTSDLFLLGDYGYKLITDIYQKYSGIYIPPTIKDGRITNSNNRPTLKLIVNNSAL